MNKDLLTAQRNELTEYVIYNKLAKVAKGEHNRRILESISQDEMRHYEFWKGIIRTSLMPSRIRVFYYVFIS